MRVKGFLVVIVSLGDEAEIIITVGRHLRGTLIEVNPAYTHQFGSPVPELSTIGGEVRVILRARGHIK